MHWDKHLQNKYFILFVYKFLGNFIISMYKNGIKYLYVSILIRYCNLICASAWVLFSLIYMLIWYVNRAFSIYVLNNFGRFKICMSLRVCGLNQKASAMKNMEVFRLGGKAVATVRFLATGSHLLSYCYILSLFIFLVLLL